MKNIILQACLVVGLALVSGVAANAQLSQQYRAEIPFDFTVDNKAFDSGTYSLEPVAPSSSSGAIALRSRKTGKAKMLGLAGIGGDSSRETGKLIFHKWNGQYVLAEIITPTFGMRMKRKQTGVRLVAQNVKPETVVVALN